MKGFNCYIINLSQDKDKKMHMSKIAEKIGINPIFINAVYGSDLEGSEISKIYSEERTKKNIGRSLTKGEIGCALSHLHIYKKIVESNIELALILEDDVITAFSEQEIIKVLERAPKEWDCILLGHHPRYSRYRDAALSFWRRQITGVRVILGEFSETPVGGYAYVISLKGAKKRLMEFSAISKPIDMWDVQLLAIYGTSPSMFKIYNLIDGKSVLDVERASVCFQRNPFQRVKDYVRALLTKLHIIWLYFFVIRIILMVIKKKKHPYKPEL